MPSARRIGLFPDTYTIDDRYHISIGGLPIRQLAQEFGTPLYVLDYETLRHRIRSFQQALQDMNPPGQAFYAGKAFLTKAMAGFLEQQHMGLDVVSGGELYTALEGGMNPSRIIFHGNVKTDEEIRFGLLRGVGYFVVDSLAELEAISRIAKEVDKPAPILLRLTPGIEAHTHAFIQTGQFDSKFGFAMQDGIHEVALQRALTLPYLELKGFHAHIGSQIFDEDPFVHNAQRLMEFMHDALERYHYWPEVVDIGGGFGVQYGPDDDPPQVSRILARVNDAMQRMTPHGYAVPTVFIEPGRAIVAEAGVTIYQVGATKTVPGGKRYAAVDGGMGDNIRPALYQASYTAQVDGKNPEDRALYTIAGRYCESGDILVKDIPLPPIEPGDYVVVFGTGAYNFAMASNYNRVPRPAVVLVYNGQASLWVKRESYEDMAHNDLPWQDPEEGLWR
ncbi:diaminopimelate decarboxylase [Sulfobacillus thermotolerans]|uniref:Diaminopimelate decarboxylase n=1 Tax=Sulfobacillus thermotolerans TaxID=338644 RepID=A0ABM6RVW2_9FIRM|nr:diaminopimelate decarboxylase [Sulfobacillus thermotolerans]